MAELRTDVQKAADDIDCDLFRVLCRTEQLYHALTRKYPQPGPRITDLGDSLSSLRRARSGIRMLMHEDDRARTA